MKLVFPDFFHILFFPRHHENPGTNPIQRGVSNRLDRNLASKAFETCRKLTASKKPLWSFKQRMFHVYLCYFYYGSL